MPRVVFITPDQQRVEVEGAIGQSVMVVAVRENIPGIDGECGGACSCATCHVIVDPDWWERVGPAGDNERDMLEFAGEVSETSRLGCQIKLDDSLDGLVVTVAER